MFKDSLKPEHWYFFAVTGINITQKLIKSLQRGEFDKTLLMREDIQWDEVRLQELFDMWYF